jgi:hypothetical protein
LSQKQQIDNYSHVWLYRMHFSIVIFVVIYFVFMSCSMCTLACKEHPTVTTSLNYKFYILFCRLFLRLYWFILRLFLFCSVTTCDEMKMKAYRFFTFHGRLPSICILGFNDLFVNKPVEYNIWQRKRVENKINNKKKRRKEKKWKWSSLCHLFFNNNIAVKWNWVVDFRNDGSKCDRGTLKRKGSLQNYFWNEIEIFKRFRKNLRYVQIDC